MLKFSVLLSIYYKEKPEYFNSCMRSIWDDQILKPSEIVLIQDGPLPLDLKNIINDWKNKLGDVFKVVPLENNVGLGEALNIGIENCRFDLIARMDTDDISLPSRFYKQIDVFRNNDIDVCGSWVSEFEENFLNIISYRKVPEYHSQIVNFAKKRCPMNHPSVMFKKSAVINAGGYKTFLWFEDYFLWVRMIQAGARFYNIQDPLVSMRSGYEQIERRRGFKYALSEFKLQKEFLKLGFINHFDFLRNVTGRFLVRIMPRIIVKAFYQVFLRKT